MSPDPTAYLVRTLAALYHASVWVQAEIWLINAVWYNRRVIDIVFEPTTPPRSYGGASGSFSAPQPEQ